MAALIYPPTQNGLEKTLGAQLDTGITASATLNNTTGLQNLKGLFVVDRIDTSGTEKAAAVREYISFTGVSGSTVTTLVRGLGGTTDQDHAVGAVVEFISDVVQQQAILDTITAEHSTAGVHAAATVTSLKATGANINTGTSDVTIVTPKAIADSNVVITDKTQTLSGKTLTKPVINGTNPTGAAYTPATGAQTVALDCAANNLHIVTGHASGTAITFTVANATNNQPFIVSILQGAVVSTITGWFATVRWAGGSIPTLTATVGKRDVFGFIRTGTNTYDGFIVGQNL